MRKLCLLSLSLLLGAAPCLAQTRYLTAALDGGQESPPVVTSARAWAIVTARDATRTVDVYVECTGLVGTSAHLHLTASGSARVILSGGPTRWQALGVVLSPNDYAALVGGGMYANVHTAANPNGEVRGTVVVPSTRMFVATLDGSQEVPPVVTSGTGQAVAFLHEPDNVLIYTVTGSGMTNITSAHLHQSPVGNIVHNLRGANGSYCGATQKLSQAQVAALNAGNLYFNIHTIANPNGEVRGNIALANPAGLTASMDGSQEVPPVVSSATGHASFRLNADKSMTYVVTTQNVVGGNSAHVHESPAGNIVLNLSGGPTVWSGTTGVLSASQLAEAAAGLWYVNVHTNANPNGEIRGTLSPAIALPSTLGAGCPGSGGTVAVMAADGAPCLGSSFSLQVFNATAGRPGAFLLGSTVFNPPIDLTVLKMGGCFLFHDLPLNLPLLTDANGCGTTPLPIPFDASLLNGVFFDQAAIVDPGSNAFGIAMSNALSSKIQ